MDSVDIKEAFFCLIPINIRSQDIYSADIFSAFLKYLAADSYAANAECFCVYMSELRICLGVLGDGEEITEDSCALAGCEQFRFVYLYCCSADGHSRGRSICLKGKGVLFALAADNQTTARNRDATLSTGDGTVSLEHNGDIPLCEDDIRLDISAQARNVCIPVVEVEDAVLAVERYFAVTQYVVCVLAGDQNTHHGHAAGRYI